MVRVNLRDLVHWRTLAAALGFLLAAAVIAAPIAAVHATEEVRFHDRLGTLPVVVTVCHNGYSSLDTGVLGTLYWKRTGFLGFGACIRATAPPEAGGTLGSYVDSDFVQANAELVNDPDEIATAYGHAFLRSFRAQFLRTEALLTALGLLCLIVLRRAGSREEDPPPWWGRRLARRLTPWPRVRHAVWPVLAVVLGTAVSSTYALHEFHGWEDGQEVGTTYPLSTVPDLSFSSPQTREVAAQVEPFLEKNKARLEARSTAFEQAATSSFATALAARGDRLRPRPGERVVLAEADPQGSLVGTAVRTAIYPQLVEALGRASVAMRTIAGDITSNGTVAEDGFVKKEAAVSRDIPTVAASGDHDSSNTVKQMKHYGIDNPNLTTVTVDGLHVTAANDPEFKTLFGGLVTNPSGVTEQQLGQKLRAVVDPVTPGIVVVHQPDAGAAYLGIDSLSQLTLGHDTVPYDDGIPDVPPGVLDTGHSHVSIGPFVIWNTDTDKITWTVVDRLGTSGGAENSPTFNRFSTPFSVPLKPVDIRLQYFNEAGLETGYATIEIDTSGHTTISDRTDVGLPAS